MAVLRARNRGPFVLIPRSELLTFLLLGGEDLMQDAGLFPSIVRWLGPLSDAEVDAYVDRALDELMDPAERADTEARVRKVLGQYRDAVWGAGDAR